MKRNKEQQQKNTASNIFGLFEFISQKLQIFIERAMYSRC